MLYSHVDVRAQLVQNGFFPGLSGLDHGQKLVGVCYIVHVHFEYGVHRWFAPHLVRLGTGPQCDLLRTSNMG